MILIIALYALLASTFTFGKILLSYFAPFFLIGIRMITAGLLLLGYLKFFKHEHFKLKRKDFGLFMQIIMFHIFVAFTFEFWALQYITSAKVCLLYNISPFIAAIFSYFWFSETMTLKKLIGLSIGFAGFIPILITSEGALDSINAIAFLSFAEIVLLIAIVSSVYGWIIMRHLIKDRGYSPIMVNGVGMLGGGVLSLVTSFAVEPVPIYATTLSELVNGLAWIGLVILIANVIYYNLYGYLLHRYSATLLSFIGFICPMFAAVYGWLLLGETMSWSFFASLGIIFCGLYLFYQEELRQGYIR